MSTTRPGEAAQTAGPPRIAWKRLIGSIGGALVLGLLLVPWSPSMPDSGLDPSWRSVSEWGVLRRVEFGSDLVFTFGPLGFLYSNQYHPLLYPYQLAFWLGSAVLIGAFFGGHWGRTPLAVSACLLVALVLATGYIQDAWLLLIPLAAALESMDPALPRQPWLAWALAILAIVASLVKFSVFVAAAAVFLIADMVRLVQRSGIPWLSVSLVLGSWLIFWAATGHWGWPTYVLSGLEVSEGYSGAMQVSGPEAELWRSLVLGAAAVGLLRVAADRGSERRAEFRLAGVTIAGAVYAFIAFKAGVVRHDGHIIITASALLLLAILSAWRIFDRGGTPALKVLAGTVVLAASYNYLDVPGRHLNSPGLWLNFSIVVLDGTRSALRSAKDLLFGDALAQFAARREEALARVRAEDPLPRIIGTVDIYDWDQADVLAHGLDYSPRPVFQSYAAYTPNLIERNYGHLAGASAPDYVLFALQWMYFRLPSLDDGKSWLLLWSRYDPVAVTASHVLLKRRTSGDRAIVTGVERSSKANWGEAVFLEHTSDAPCVWAEVDIRENLAGRLRSILFKAPIVEVELAFTGGETVRHRFVPGMGRTGFLASPFVETTNEFVGVCSADAEHTARRVEWMSFHTRKSERIFFSDQIVVRTRGIVISGGREHAKDPDGERTKE